MLISHQRAYFDVRVFNPYAPFYQSSSLSSYVHRNEQQKQRAYDERGCDVVMGCFSLVFSAAVGCGPMANFVLKRLVSSITTHQGEVL